MRPTARPIAGAALLGVLATSLVPQPASACGGFFCNNSQPVNQAAERILFSVDDDGTVTATIQILYSGEADAFAWVLPVSGVPEVAVSSNLAFARLQSATNPSYLLTTTIEGTCNEDRGFGRGPFASDGTSSPRDGAAAADAGGPPVTIADSGSVGPYDYVIISVDPAVEDVTTTAREWLADNEYQIDDAGAERLEPYLTSGMNLLAFRLTKGNSTGSIRPVQITFGAGAPAIPIRPTAVAAIEDMGVMVFVLGRARAIPVNYLSLELNEALINWLSPGPTYDSVVIEAANQAGGQGFVTELADEAAPFADVIMNEGEVAIWESVSADFEGDDASFLAYTLSSYFAWDGVRDAVSEHVTLPEGIDIDAFIGCPGCYLSPGGGVDLSAFDRAGFIASFEEHVIEPMTRTRALFEDHRYLTRFYTTMSADEMTRDPMFDFNTNLPDVSNVHNAERIIECSPSINQFEAPWRVVLPSGDIVRGTGTSWPFTAAEADMPANLRIRRLDTEGEGEVIIDNTEAVSTALATYNRTVPGPRYPGGGGYCSVSHDTARGASALTLVLGAIGIAVMRRRRRA